ncbi:MAG TPA: hypothetical protein VLH38_05040, partial [Patescibacteria group bacterium]|nr:hypothetical protein [Patescibacteria group bacterium]
IGISQAAPGVVWAVNSLPDVPLCSIGLVTPLGFTKHVFGPSDETRIRELKKRAAKSLLQRNQFPFASLRNLYVFLIITRARFLEPENGASDRKYAEGLSHDITGECVQIMAKRPGVRFSVVLGERDTLFPPSEVLDSLKDARLGAIKVSVIPGMTHASFASNHHKELLQKIIAIIHA